MFRFKIIDLDMSGKKKVKATIEMRWVLYDIENETYLRGRSMQNKENHKEVASLHATEDEENREKILRSVKRAFSEVQDRLGEYLDEQAAETDNSHYDGRRDLALNLEMPSNFNEVATMEIGEATHAYLVNMAIGDWYLVTNRAEADSYYALAAKNLARLQAAASSRRRPKAPE